MTNFDYEKYAKNILCVDLREKSLEQALFEIQKRPWLWLVENNIACLKSFVTGWLNAQINYPDEEYMKGFSNYVLCHFGEQESSLDWHGIISDKFSDKTEPEKMEYFYALLMEYSVSRSA